jgi:hypothetical protein
MRTPQLAVPNLLHSRPRRSELNQHPADRDSDLSKRDCTREWLKNVSFLSHRPEFTMGQKVNSQKLGSKGKMMGASPRQVCNAIRRGIRTVINV